MTTATPTPLPKVITINPTMGCDPEFFFKQNGETIGAETVLPATGLSYGAGKFIIDGVQAELNPAPHACRANLANELKVCFATLKRELERQGKGVTVDFGRTVEISQDNLMKLNENSRKFGCAPSSSIYKNRGIKIDTIDPAKYRTRAAGGHIHIGHSNIFGFMKAFTYDISKTVAMLDLIAGNTMVLIDRDKSNIERRKLYGKAGEFRVPTHGLEYRTLSNFWLTSYPLMSLAFGLCRLAVQLAGDSNNSAKFFDAFTSKVTPKDVKEAINKNDFDLAMQNFKAIEPLICEVATANDTHPIHSANIVEFYHFVKMTKEHGIEHWFKDDPMTHWTTLPEAHAGGFADYLITNVRPNILKTVRENA